MSRVLTKSNFLLFCALLVFASLAWHNIVFNHKHPEFMEGEGKVQALFHGGDKKWFTALFLLSLFTAHIYAAVYFLLFLEIKMANVSLLSRTELRTANLYDFLRDHLAQGLIHPKPY